MRTARVETLKQWLAETSVIYDSEETNNIYFYTDLWRNFNSTKLHCIASENIVIL